MSTNTNMNISMSMDYTASNFMHSFSKEGRVWSHEEYNTRFTEAEIFDLIGEAFHFDIRPNSTGVYSSVYGGVHIMTVQDVGEYRNVMIRTMADDTIVRVLGNLLSSKPFNRKREEGVFDISITHWYLDKTQSASGEMKHIEHYRDTNSFNKLFPEMYPKIDINEMMRQFSVSDESLMILSGQPGTGKTCVAKMMMAAHAGTQEQDIDVVYVKDKDLLKKDQFWAMMSRIEPDMMILDDLDNELLPRGKDGNQIVSNMLSYSDGIFDIDTKILITTNLTDSKIDKALVRPGRSFDTLCLPQLDRDEALSIWLNKFEAPLEEFNSRFGELPVISQAAVMSEHQRYLKSNAPTYLLDPSISVRKLVEEGEVINHEED